MLLERLTDSLPSLGADAPTLLLMKNNCALPNDSSWTELDSTLSLLLDAAEEFIDWQTGTTYRPRNFRLTVRSVHESQLVSIPSEITGRWYVLPVGKFCTVRLPVRPVTTAPTITWTDNLGNTGTFTLNTDFTFQGGLSLTPEITFLPVTPTSWPETGLVPWPFVFTFSTVAGNQQPNLHKLAIVQLAAYYYRNPQAMGQDVPDMGQGFWGMLTQLKGDFL